MAKTVIELDNKMDACRLEVFAEISAIHTQITEQNTLRLRMDKKLDEIAEQTRNNSKEFKLHDKEEMEKYDKIVEAIKDLTDTMKQLIVDTQANTGFIQSEQQNRDIEERVAERMLEIEKPNREAWHKIKMTALATITVAVLGGIGAALKFGIELYAMLHGGQ